MGVWPRKVECDANGPLSQLDIAKRAKEDSQPVDLWKLSYDRVVQEARENAGSVDSFGRNFIDAK